MHTAAAARGQGVGRAMVDHLARRRPRPRVPTSEPGDRDEDEFAPARALYRRVGFTPCEPFGAYTVNPHSTCMTLELA